MITIAGRIPIIIHPVFWIITLLFGYNIFGTIEGTAIWTIVVLFSVLIHEYGHALTAQFFGHEARIELIALGGVAHHHGQPLKLWQEFLIVCNGPAASFLIYWVASKIWGLSETHSPTLINRLLFITMQANFFWTIFNLIPVFPMDGGRILSIIMEAIFGERGVRWSYAIGVAVGILLGALCYLTEFAPTAGMFLLFAAFESYRAWQASESFSPRTRIETVTLAQRLDEAQHMVQMGLLGEASVRLEEIRNETKKGKYYVGATQYLALIAANKRQYEEVVALLLPIKSSISLDALRLLHAAAFDIGEWKQAAQIGDRVYQRAQTHDTALLNSLSHALLEEVRPCLGWLERSISDGLPNPHIVLDRSEFDRIRHESAFKELQSSIRPN